jgi:hypothetical protein
MAGACAKLDNVFAGATEERSFENVPGLIVVVMQIPGRDISWRWRLAAGIALLGNGEGASGGPKHAPARGDAVMRDLLR